MKNAKRLKGLKVLVSTCLFFISVVYMIGCNSKSISVKDTYNWPASTIDQLLPEPESKHGKIQIDSEDSFMIDIYKTSKGVHQFFNYILRKLRRGCGQKAGLS